MGYLLYQLGAGFLPSTVLRIQIRSTVVIPGKHDLRLAGEKAIDFQRWPLEATERVMVIWSLISLNMGLPETLDDVSNCLHVFFPWLCRELFEITPRLQKSKGKLKAIAAISCSNPSVGAFHDIS